MKTTVLRWVFAPRTSWCAWRLTRAASGQIDFDTAWRAARVRLHPDETEFRTHGHRPPKKPPDPSARSSLRRSRD
ncbi:hypothetical protein [Kitasatospora sp. NPDC093558]|uniref:hypothetical protein n=1 Tax=Kitasatospora sp. NPDC093558 TaxID=3155201 RepID=UPI003427E4B2